MSVARPDPLLISRDPRMSGATLSLPHRSELGEHCLMFPFACSQFSLLRSLLLLLSRASNWVGVHISWESEPVILNLIQRRILSQEGDIPNSTLQVTLNCPCLMFLPLYGLPSPSLSVWLESVNTMRYHFRDYVRVHGKREMTQGGPNLIIWTL